MTCEEPGCTNQAEYRVPFLGGDGYLLVCASDAKGEGERMDGQIIFYGARVRDARVARGMTREELAGHLGVNEYQLWLIEERGALISDEVMGRIALYKPLGFPHRFYEQRPKPERFSLGSLAYHVPEAEICSVCHSRFTEALCDYPVGDRRTCDRALCGGCRHRAGPGSDIDYCPSHAKGQPSLFGRQEIR